MQTHQFSEEQNKTFRFKGRNGLYGKKFAHSAEVNTLTLRKSKKGKEGI